MEFSLDHIHLRCRDLEEAVAFYSKMFNAELVARFELPQMTLVRMKIGDATLILSPKQEGMKVQDLSGEAQWGVYEIGFYVDDAYKAVEELKSKGAEFIREVFEVRPGVQVAFMKAPDGVEIEILHRD